MSYIQGPLREIKGAVDTKVDPNELYPRPFKGIRGAAD